MASGQWYIAYIYIKKKKNSKYIRYLSSPYKTTLGGNKEIHRFSEKKKKKLQRERIAQTDVIDTKNTYNTVYIKLNK